MSWSWSDKTTRQGTLNMYRSDFYTKSVRVENMFRTTRVERNKTVGGLSAGCFLRRTTFMTYLHSQPWARSRSFFSLPVHTNTFTVPAPGLFPTWPQKPNNTQRRPVCRTGPINQHGHQNQQKDMHYTYNKVSKITNWKWNSTSTSWENQLQKNSQHRPAHPDWSWIPVVRAAKSNRPVCHTTYPTQSLT